MNILKSTFWRREWQHTLVFLPEEPHGHRRAWWATVYGIAESDMTEQLSLTHSDTPGYQFKIVNLITFTFLFQIR